MAETASQLVARVIPRVPVRQWVLSFPFPLRILFATPPELLTPVLRITHRDITGSLLSSGLRSGEQAAAVSSCSHLRASLPAKRTSSYWLMPCQRLGESV